MSLQYIHTSARRGLEPGKSGFCCIARDRDLPADLEKELERLSRYEHIPGKSSALILRHLSVTIRSGNFHVLSRLSDAGVDYSKRNNHIAHHLVFSEEEISVLPDPATILLFWEGWRDSWVEPPRILSEKDQFYIRDLNTAKEHRVQEFASPLEEGHPSDTAFTIEEGQEQDLALHFRNVLLSLPATQRWNISFTNFILTSDQPAQLLWRGNWRDRPLPFEFELTTEKTSVCVPNQIAEEAIEEINSIPEDDTSRITRRAPKVEIPDELTKTRRKRPKRRWTRRRLSKTLNLTLAILAILCCGTIAFLLLDFSPPAELKGQSIAKEQHSSHPISIDTSIQETSDPDKAWASIVASGRLYEEVDQATTIAEQLYKQGEIEPLQIAGILKAVKTAIESRESDQPVFVEVPKNFISYDSSQWLLNSTIALEIEPLGLVLVPDSLFAFFQPPNAQNPIFVPLREHCSFDRFIPDDTILTLKSVRRSARDRLVQNGIDAITAAQDYRNQWQSLAEDDILESIQKLETAFEIDADKGYLGLDGDGLLTSPDQLNITTHIKNLYERFMLRSVSSFIPSPEFRDALNTASLGHSTAIDEARAIYQVFATAKAPYEPLASNLDQIRNQWHETFIRDDLMEETMINFNLERLANRKRNLATLQSQFNGGTLSDLDSANRIIDSVDRAEQSIQAIGSDSRWALSLRTP